MWKKKNFQIEFTYGYEKNKLEQNIILYANPSND